MKGCAFRALLQLVEFLVIAGLIGVALQYLYGVAPLDAIPALIFGGLLAWMSVQLVRSAVTAWREQAALRAGIAGAEPIDGRRTILVGEIQPLGASIRAPLSDRECVAYTFEIYEMKRVGKSSSKVVYADGVAITPSTIETRSGSYRLLAVPELDCPDTDLDGAAARARALEQLSTLTYEPRKPFSRPSIEQQWNDADGAFLRETLHVEGDVDLTRCRLSEKCLERGARVCVFGEYSAAKRAIVANTHDWSQITRVMKGDADVVARQLGGSVVRRSIGAVLSAAAAVGVIAAFVSSLG